jgi:hypothetical protein
MAGEQTRSFEQLSEHEQKAAMDVAVAVTVLGTRIPTLSKSFTNAVLTEFTNCYKVVPNVAKYALRELGVSLFKENWEFTVHKTGVMLTTEFKPVEGGSGPGNGQIHIER